MAETKLRVSKHMIRTDPGTGVSRRAARNTVFSFDEEGGLVEVVPKGQQRRQQRARERARERARAPGISHQLDFSPPASPISSSPYSTPAHIFSGRFSDKRSQRLRSTAAGESGSPTFTKLEPLREEDEIDSHYLMKQQNEAEGAVLVRRAKGMIHQCLLDDSSSTASPTASSVESAGSEPDHLTAMRKEAVEILEKSLTLCTNTKVLARAHAALAQAKQLETNARKAQQRAKQVTLFKARFGEGWAQKCMQDRSATDEDLRQVFDLVDEDASGQLDRSVHTWPHAFTSLPFNLSLSIMPTDHSPSHLPACYHLCRDEIELLMAFFANQDDPAITDQAVDAAMRHMDQDQSGAVSFAEFLQWWHSASHRHHSSQSGSSDDSASTAAQSPRQSNTSTESSSLRAIFSEYASVKRDGEGGDEMEIGALDLYNVMAKLARPITVQEADFLLNEIDTDKSGTISFEEFEAMLSNTAGSTHGLAEDLRRVTLQKHGLAMRAADKGWAQGSMMRLKNGVFAPCFSNTGYHKAIAKGAMKAGLSLEEQEGADTMSGWARIRARFGINIEPDEAKARAAVAMQDLKQASLALHRASETM